MTIETHYSVLKVTRDAPEEVIAAAYKALARLYHPDRNSSPEAVVIMANVNAAYKVLSDPQQKAEHDAWIDRQGKEDASALDVREKIKKVNAEAAKWVAWAEKTAQEAREAKQRHDKALNDLTKAKSSDREKWEAWVAKTEQEAREAQERADKAAEQSAKALADVEAVRQSG